MTKTASDGNILTKKGKADKDKVRCDWTMSVTSTPQGVALWEEVEYSRFEEWEKTHPEPQPEDEAEMPLPSEIEP